MADATYEKFLKRWEEVTDIPPQTLGPLTPFYKSVTKRLKVMPWPWYMGAALLLVVGLYLIFGSSLARLVTLLQRGF